MEDLPTGELLYLFYAFAYLDEDSQSVTQGTVRKHLPKAYRDRADEFCQSLFEQKLLESPKRRRVALTEAGKKAMVENLRTTDYRFRTSKGSRVVNALLRCLQMTFPADASVSSEMSFEDFVPQFKDFYFEERSRQSSKGAYVMREKEVLSGFLDQYKISEHLLTSHYKRLQDEGFISAVDGRVDKNLQWVE